MELTEQIDGMIKSLDQIIEATQKKVQLYGEMRKMFLIAKSAGVHPRDIEGSGYNPKTDPRWDKYPNWYKQHIQPMPNYVVLKDGRRVDFTIDWKAELQKLRGS